MMQISIKSCCGRRCTDDDDDGQALLYSLIYTPPIQ